MIDKWFLEEVQNLISLRKRLVIIDPSKSFEFIIPLLSQGKYIILKTDENLYEKWEMVKEELFLRADIESKYPTENVIIYTTRDKNKLSFLYDYCFTHACLDLSFGEEWLKKKLYKNTGLQIQFDKNKLLNTAKLSIGKDIDWWKKQIQNLESLIDLQDELLPFLDNPEEYMEELDKDIRKLFEETLLSLLNQPYMPKPPKTIAGEIARHIFDSLLSNSISDLLLSVYYRWVDSEAYRPSLENYLNIWKKEENWIKMIKVKMTSIESETASFQFNIHIDHCFENVDLAMLDEIIRNIKNPQVVLKYLEFVKKRIKSAKAGLFIPTWWKDIILLLEYNGKELIHCDSLEKVIQYYHEYFVRIDRAMRRVYSHFLQDRSRILPLQEYYECLNNALLDKWYARLDHYENTQHGFLVDLFNNATTEMAVIVGDGLRLEIADYVAETLKKEYCVNKNIMLADLPSETEHNMSALYTDKKEVVKIHKEREKKLIELTGKNIVFMSLEALNYNHKAELLVLSYKDIDSIGETLQMGAIKLFDEFEKVLIEKIKLLLNMGYKEVYLITDHGFVLTGLLTDSDKIEPDIKGQKEVHERYIRSVELAQNKDWITLIAPYQEYKYLHLAKNYRPFKSRGVYGYSHGGFTPQEVVIPKYIFSKEKQISSLLEIQIENKNDLLNVTGEIYQIKLITTSKEETLFNSSRKIQLVFFNKDEEINRSHIINIEYGKKLPMEYSFSHHKEISVIIIDAETKEQIDRAKIKKSGARDLDGLF